MFDYGNKDTFQRDHHAPIKTSNDGDKNALGYVSNTDAISSRQPIISGIEILSDFRITTNDTGIARALSLLYYFPNDQYLEIRIDTGKMGETIAFSPESIGADMQMFSEQGSNSSAEILENYPLADFGDEEFAKSVANMINSTVVAFSKYYPISSTDEYIGVGMPLAVVSDGQIKTRIVFRASVAIDLVSDDPMVEENAQCLILHMLAGCALKGLITAKFPDQILKSVPDQFEAFLHEYSAGLFEVFFCASFSTKSQEKVEQLEKLALMALQNAFDGILEKRMEYRRGGDIEAFFDEAAKLSRTALSFLATMFGAYKGLNLPIPGTNTVMSYLAEKGLAEWAELFNADLAGFEAGFGRNLKKCSLFIATSSGSWRILE